MMWVVYCKAGGRVTFADGGWGETRYIKGADRFDSRGSAITCASAMRAAHGGNWHPVRFREAVSW